MFFNHKTANEMLSSDWSSDVCSSDLHRRPELCQCCQTLAGSLGAVHFEQDLAQLVADCDRRIGRRIDAATNTGFDLAEGDLVGDIDRPLQAGTAGHLQIDRKSTRLNSSH